MKNYFAGYEQIYKQISLKQNTITLEVSLKKLNNFKKKIINYHNKLNHEEQYLRDFANKLSNINDEDFKSRISSFEYKLERLQSLSRLYSEGKTDFNSQFCNCLKSLTKYSNVSQSFDTVIPFPP